MSTNNSVIGCLKYNFMFAVETFRLQDLAKHVEFLYTNSGLM